MFATLAVAVLVFTTAESAVVKILAGLTFYKATVPFEITSSYPDLASNPELLKFLPDVDYYCVIGVWRFYPEVNYNKNLTDSGYMFSNEPEKEGDLVENALCGPLDASRGQLFAQMKSLRHLGGRDISSKQLAVYSDFWFTGIETIITSQRPDLENVRSYMITAPTYNTATNMGAVAITLFKVYRKNNYEADDGMACIALTHDSFGDPAYPAKAPTKLYTVGEVDLGNPKEFGSARLLPFSTLDNFHQDCKSDIYVIPSINLPPDLA